MFDVNTTQFSDERSSSLLGLGNQAEAIRQRMANDAKTLREMEKVQKSFPDAIRSIMPDGETGYLANVHSATPKAKKKFYAVTIPGGSRFGYYWQVKIGSIVISSKGEFMPTNDVLCLLNSLVAK